MEQRQVTKTSAKYSISGQHIQGCTFLRIKPSPPLGWGTISFEDLGFKKGHQTGSFFIIFYTFYLNIFLFSPKNRFFDLAKLPKFSGLKMVFKRGRRIRFFKKVYTPENNFNYYYQGLENGTF